MSTAAQARVAILQRLQSAPTFHPSSADLFADWGNQPGDIVTLRSGDNSYSVPIYGMRTRWAGSTRVEVTATGNKKRAGIAEASKKEYSRRGGGYYGQQFLHREFVSEDGTLRSLLEMTASHLRTEFNQSADGLHSEIVQTASYIRATMDADKAGLHSEIVQTASYWRATFEDETNSIRSLVEQTASSWRTSIEEVVGSDGRITAASIGIAINKTGSTAKIKADRIYLDASQTVSLASVMSVSSAGASFTGDVITNGAFRGDFAGGSFSYSTQEQGHSISHSMLKKAAVDGNTLKIWTFADSDDNPSVTFSKAVTLSGAWGSGDDAEKFIVTASSGATYKFAPPLRLNGTTQYSNFSAEITDDSVNPPVAKRVVRGYLVPGGSTTGSYVDVNTESDGTGAIVARISVGSLYAAGNNAGQLTGWTEAYQKVAWAGANTSSASMTIKAPAATKVSNPNQQSVTYTLSSDNNVAYIKQGAVVVAQLTHNKYSSGYNSGYSNGSPSSAALGSRLSGSTWYITVTKGDGSNSSLACDLANLKSVVGMMYKDSPGSDHQGTLTSGKYVYLGVSSSYNADKTWYVPDSGGGEQHTNSVSMTYDGMTTSTQGGVTVYTFNYHYTRNTASPFFQNKTLWW